MSRVGLLIIDISSDVGEGDVGDSLQNSLLPRCLNSEDGLTSVDVVSQQFESSWREYKADSDSLEHCNENKKSLQSSDTINESGEDVDVCNDDVEFSCNLELLVDVISGSGKKMDFETALLNDETRCSSTSKVDRDSTTEEKIREDENMDVENCPPDALLGDELIPSKEDEGTPTQVSQSLPLQMDKDVIGGGSQFVRVDCTSHFKTDKEFWTKEEVLHWAKVQGRQTGTVLTIKKSQGPQRGRAPRLYLKCERGGKYESHGGPPPKGLRKTGTKKCACPFELGTTWSSVGEKEWKIKVFVRNGIHNHELAKTTEGHSYAGKLTKKEFNIVADMTMAGVKPKEVMHALRKNDPENCTSLHQIYNARHAVRLMEGKSQMHDLPLESNDNRYADFNRNLELFMDAGDGSTKEWNIETASPDDETRSPSPPKVDGVNSSAKNRREEVENVIVENCVPGPPMEDKGIPPKKDEMKEDEGNCEVESMRGIEPLLGDVSSDVGGSLGNSLLLSASASFIPSPDDALPAVMDNQQFEHLLTLRVYKPSSNSLEPHTENKKSSQSSITISLSGDDVNMRDEDVNFNPNMELDMDVDDGGSKKLNFDMALPDDEISCQSPQTVGGVSSSEKKGREAGDNVDDENCVVCTHMDDEGLLPNKRQLEPPQPTQALQSIPMESDNDIRVDCSHHFKTDKVFRTKEEVLHWAKLQGRQSGCVLTIKKSQEARCGRAPRLYLRCERGGKYESHGGPPPKGLRKSGTKKCACPFELGTTWSWAGEKEWKVKVFVRNGIHNHQLAKFTEGHTHAGKLTKKELGIVANMAKAGIRPREILHALRKNDPGNCTSLHQIYNAIHAIKMKDMDGKNPTQNLPTQLTDDRGTTSSPNEVLNEIGNLCTASTLELCGALDTADKLIRSNSDAISLPERVRRLENIVGLGSSTESSIELISDANSLPERVKRLENIVGIGDSAENSIQLVNYSDPSSTRS